jgi:hypothetical protein
MMTKKFVLGMFILMAVAMLAANGAFSAITHQNVNTAPVREDVFYQEGFENGLNGWVVQDGTLPSSMWHISNLATAEGMTPHGTSSWWMGDETIGGYINQVYVVLDTPVVNALPASTHLTFDLAYACEDPAGATAPYTGWDGCDVRISTDNGATWTVIAGTPAYNCTSLYSFGFIHGEGANMAGWGGTSDGWQTADFDLSTYAGQNVKIRFAFASDGAFCTTNDGSLFGMIVDNIQLASYSNNAEAGEGGMTYTSMVGVGGQLFHIADAGATAPSPTHALVCSNDQGSYNSGMLDWAISPSITLPTSGDIRADVFAQGLFDDNDAWPDVDFWHFEVSPDNGTAWNYMSNPGDDPNGDDYVYSDIPDAWTAWSTGYQQGGYVTMFAGQTVKFRLGFESDADTPIGTGLMFDNFTVYYTVFLPTPQSLTSSIEDNNVTLNWASPFSGGQEGWLAWDDGELYTSIGATAGEAVIDASARWTATDLLPFSGGSITQIKFIPCEAACDYSVKIWSGAGGATEAYSQAVPTVTLNDWTTVTLTTPYPITVGEELYIGYTADTTTGNPCGLDAGPAVAGHGDYYRIDSSGGWGSLNEDSSGEINGNWNIEALVTQPTGDTHAITPNRDLTGYKVYRSTESGVYTDSLDVVGPTTTTYVDANPAPDAMNYYVVTAVYTDGESPYSNETYVYAMPATAQEYYYDDGVSDSTYAPAVQTYLATKFHPEIQDGFPAHLLKMKIFLTAVGSQNIVLKCWPVNNQGMPGTAFISSIIDHNTLTQGWNMIDLPDSVITGDFFVGIMGSANPSTVGVDFSNSGSSATCASNVWSDLNHGNFMIRAIVDLGVVGQEDEVLPVKAITATNYPNPFNPVTTISLSLPAAGKTALRVYNTRGQLVRTLVDEMLPAGDHNIVWNGRDDNGAALSSGLYLYRVEANGQTITRKTMLLK